MPRAAALAATLALVLWAGAAPAQISLFGLGNSLVQFVLARISTPGSLEITAEGVQEGEDGRSELAGVRVADAQGVWLEIDALALVWSPVRILRGELQIDRLAARGVRVLRRPGATGAQAAPAEPGAARDPFAWPRSPIATRVDEMRLDGVTVAAGVIAAQSIAFDALGSARDEGPEQAATLTLRRTDAVEGRIELDYLRDFPGNGLRLRLTADEAAGGVAGELAGFPPDSPVRMRIDADGPLTDWAVTLAAEAERVFAAEGAATVDLGAPAAVEARLTVRPGEAAPPAVVAALAPQAALTLRAREGADGVVRVETGTIRAPALTADAAGTVVRATGALDLTLALSAGPAMAGLVEGMDFAAIGFDGRVSGPAQALRATGALSLEGLRTAPVDLADADLRVDVAVDGAEGGARIGFDVAGAAEGLRLDRLAPETVGRADLAASGAWDGAAQALDLTRLALRAPLLTLEASGRADLGADAAALSYALVAPDLGPVAAAYGVDAGGAARVRGRAEGALSAPRLTGEARLEALRYGEEALGTVALTHEATLGAAPEGRVALTAEGSRFGPAEIAAGFRLADGVLAVSDLTADALGIAAEGAVTVALDTGLAEGAVAARIADLGPASRLAGAPATGSGTARVALRAPDGRQDAEVALEGDGLAAGSLRLDRLSLAADVTDALGAGAAAAGRLDVDGLSAPGATVARLRAEGAATGLRGSPGFEGRIEGEGLAAGGASVAAFAAEGRGADLAGAGSATVAATASGIAHPGAQAAVAELRFEGSASDLFGAPAAEGRLTARGLAAMGATLAALEAEGAGTDLIAAPGGRLTLTARDLSHPQGRVEEARLQADGTDLLGDGRAAATLTARGLSGGGATAARLDARAEGADFATAPTGRLSAALTGVGGAVETARVALEAALAQAQGAARLTARLDAAPARAGEMSFGAATAAATVEDALGPLPRIDATATVDGADLGAAVLDRLAAGLRGPLDRLDLRLDAEGRGADGEPARLALAARADAAAQPATAVVSTLEAGFAGAEARLESPARLSLGESTTLRDLNLSLPGGRLAGEAGLHPDGLSGDLRLDLRDVAPGARLAGLPLDAGSLDAEADFDTRPGRARGRARLTGRGIAIAGDNSEAGLDADAALDWDGRRAAAQASVRGPFEQPLTLEAAVPLRATGGLLPAPPRGAPVDGRVRWRGRIGDLWALLPVGDHVLDGDLRLDLALSGPIAAPTLAGDIALSDGRYENLEFGTILTNLSAGSRIEADGAFALLAQADDGTGRPVRANASLGGGALDARVVAEGATLVRRDDATAQISLDITAAGPLAAPAIAGTVTVDRAEVRLVNATPPGLPDLGPIRIKGEPPAPPVERAGAAIGLDLSIAAARNIFVRGRGLDSEWNMNLQVRGTAAEPVVTGSIERVRGVLVLAGVPFDLLIGFVRFFGQVPVDPDLEIGLVRENEGVRGGVFVRGPVSEPRVSFESQPSLPESEVLPRVLFGRSQQSLTPGQGLQLAAGLATLLQGSGGPLDAVRSTIGLDVLRVEDDALGDGGATVTAGQNVADGVFVGARQPLDGGSARVVVEIEVTPSITVDTEIGQEEGSSFGLNWRRDF